MDPRTSESQWQDLSQIVAAGDGGALRAYFEALPPGEAARAISHLGEDEQARVFTLLAPGDVAQLLEGMAEVQAADVIEELPPADAAAILQQLASDDQADLLAELDREDAAAILAAMDPEEARAVRALAQYPPDVAGGLMVTEFLAYPRGARVRDVIDDLRRHVETYADYQVQYIYVVGTDRTLVGVLRLRDLLLARPEVELGRLMLADPVAVADRASLEELEDCFDRYRFLGVPVVDEAGRLVGLVRRSAVEEALARRSEGDYLKSQGIVGGEELRSLPFFTRSTRRLSWLSVNILLNIAAASVIAFYQETLAAVIALAAFLPIISDMSGCSGNQAVAVSMRELALGLVKPADLARVWFKEVWVGLANGLVLGLLLGGVAWLWRGNPYLGLVVGGALALNTLVAVSLGGTIPLILKRLRLDPALASGPILTTVTDLCGFFFALSFAAALLPRLTG